MYFHTIFLKVRLEHGSIIDQKSNLTKTNSISRLHGHLGSNNKAAYCKMPRESWHGGENKTFVQVCDAHGKIVWWCEQQHLKKGAAGAP